MKIGVLSRNQHLYSTSRLVQAARERGHSVHVVDYLRCYMDITSERPAVLLAGESQSFDAVIPRIGASHTFYGTAVVRQFEMMGVYTVSPSEAISRSRDKLRSLQILSRAGVDMPVTGFAHATKDIDGLLDTVGGAPVVVKLLEGTQGSGVVLAETRKAAGSVIEAFRQLDANILVQEFIEEADGADVRVIVIGNKAIAAMRRKSKPGEFRSNLHRGGTASVIKVTPELERVAVAAAESMGLGVAGVDILQSNRGPLVLEINSSPGLEGIEGATHMDVASEVIRYVEKNVSSPTWRWGRG